MLSHTRPVEIVQVFSFMKLSQSVPKFTRPETASAETIIAQLKTNQQFCIMTHAEQVKRRLGHLVTKQYCKQNVLKLQTLVRANYNGSLFKVTKCVAKQSKLKFPLYRMEWTVARQHSNLKVLLSCFGENYCGFWSFQGKRLTKNLMFISGCDTKPSE